MPELPLFDSPNESDDLARRGASDTERRIYDLIRAQKGYRHPVSIRLLHSVTGLSERVIKEAVATLIVSYGMRIGAIRSDPPGYFMIESAEDLDIAIQPYRGQILAMLRRLRVLQGKHQVREWLGQQAVEFE